MTIPLIACGSGGFKPTGWRTGSTHVQADDIRRHSVGNHVHPHTAVPARLFGIEMFTWSRPVRAAVEPCSTVTVAGAWAAKFLSAGRSGVEFGGPERAMIPSANGPV